MPVETLVIASRFRGPPNSGNGGYVCGLLAKNLPGPVSVRLRSPPPLDVEVRLESDVDTARLFHGSTLVGEARCTEDDFDFKRPPTYQTAELAVSAYLGFRKHTFPGCFVCGPQRAQGDGMRIFPGWVSEQAILAAPWIPDPSLQDDSGHVAKAFIWAALDCPSGFAVLPLPDGVAIVLGELSASINGSIRPGQRCVTSAWPLGAQGRKRFAASAVHSEAGELIAVARAVWIEVPASAWNAS